MVLADKAKSILISSVSHELRTPLHGILAAAELLADTELDQNQVSFLRTVQSCGNSLIETVNHVLDFTKLSGGSSGSGSTLKLSKVNLSTLIEQTAEGCWVGQRAKTFLGDADVGSYYAPDSSPTVQRGQRSTARDALPIEIVVDVAHREKGWNVRCEKGGLRRVLMNLIGNSLKFTKVSIGVVDR
jgi:signal transduction histidine kinase